MNAQRGNALVLLLVVLAAAAAVEGLFLFRLERRIAELEARLPETPGRASSTPLALADEVRALETRLDETAGKAARAEEQSGKNASRLDEVTRAAEDLRQRVLTGERGGATLPAGALEEAVAKAVEEKVRNLPQGGEWKPTMQQFKETLGLAEDQTDRVERVFDDAKHEAFTLLALKRPDGGSALDDLVNAFKDPQDPTASVQKVFLGLFTQKIPGRDEPYIAEIIRIKQKAQEGLDGILDEGQRKNLSRMNLDHLGVQTRYDPFAEYVRDSLR